MSLDRPADLQLWAMMRRPELKRVRGLADEIARLSVDSLVEAYRHDCVVAPRRQESGKRYLVETHDGRPRSGAFTNRNEEHLALALWNGCAQGAGLLLQPPGLRLHLVDYQVPLKAAQSDRIGKLDLLGLLDDGTLCLVELKAPEGRGDSPLLALLEALSYAAVIEANRNALDAELRDKFPEATGSAPVVLLLGPEAWWRAWKHSAPAGEWIPRLARVCDELSRRLGLEIACGALEPCDLKDLRHGLHGEPPRLRRVAEVVTVDGLPHVPPPKDMGGYVSSMLTRFHRYARSSFPLDRFDEHIGNQDRPPVFSPRVADNNLLTPTDPVARMRVIAAVPDNGRHKHFASMRSSQALAQSVFAGLAESGRVSLLASVRAECGRPAFAPDVASMQMVLEKSVSWLGEPRPTSIDVWFEDGDRRIAVECKLTEGEFGTCSRPRLHRDDPAFCDGSYSIQQGRDERCALTEAGISYWRHLPSILDWSAGEDHAPCPLGWTYQLVRNLLAVMVARDGAPSPRGHALVVYDSRNPAFSPEGVARRAIRKVQGDLRSPGLLRTVSWQAIAESLAGEAALEWMVKGLAAKYGFLVGRPRPSGEHPSEPTRQARDHSRSRSLSAMSYVLAPLIDPSGHMLLSVRGNSYRLRSPRISDWHRGFVLPKAPTVDTLLAAGLVTRIEPVDERRAVEEKGWWRERLIEIDRRQR